MTSPAVNILDAWLAQPAQVAIIRRIEQRRIDAKAKLAAREVERAALGGWSSRTIDGKRVYTESRPHILAKRGRVSTRRRLAILGYFATRAVAEHVGTTASDYLVSRYALGWSGRRMHRELLDGGLSGAVDLPAGFPSQRFFFEHVLAGYHGPVGTPDRDALATARKTRGEHWYRKSIARGVGPYIPGGRNFDIAAALLFPSYSTTAAHAPSSAENLI